MKNLAIIGAGPAGLTAALVARRFGFQVSVFEQAKAFRSIGGGLLLQSNGLRALDALGLLDALESAMVSCDIIALDFLETRLGVFNYRTLPIPQNRCTMIMRYELEERLLHQAQAAGAQIFFDHACQSVQIQDQKALVSFQNGKSQTFDWVIGADGIHSVVRQSLNFSSKELNTGESYLRGISPVRCEVAEVREIWGRDGRRFGMIPLPNDRTYFYCSVKTGDWPRIFQKELKTWVESWADLGQDPVKIARAVKDWKAIYHDEIHEAEVAHWGKGPVFLIGDAAHAMTPNLGQGTNSAMVDALVLIQLLNESEDLKQVLIHYEAVRKKFVTKIQKYSRYFGAWAAWTNPFLVSLRNQIIRFSPRFETFYRGQFLIESGFNPKEERFFKKQTLEMPVS